MRYVYIASPYALGDVSFNVRESLSMADLLLSRGFIPYAPLLSHFWNIISPKTHSDWLAYDFAWLEKCDCVLRMPGLSIGADAEVRHARELGIPVFYTLAELLI